MQWMTERGPAQVVGPHVVCLSLVLITLRITNQIYDQILFLVKHDFKLYLDFKLKSDSAEVF